MAMYCTPVKCVMHDSVHGHNQFRSYFLVAGCEYHSVLATRNWARRVQLLLLYNIGNSAVCFEVQVLTQPTI